MCVYVVYTNTHNIHICIGKKREAARRASAEASATHGPVLTMFSKSGRLHPGTKRVRYYIYKIYICVYVYVLNSI